MAGALDVMSEDICEEFRKPIEKFDLYIIRQRRLWIEVAEMPGNKWVFIWVWGVTGTASWTPPHGSCRGQCADSRD